MVSVHAYEFIIRWCHYCSISVLILYTYCLSFLHSVHQSFPVLLPVFHRIKVHSCSMYAIGVKGFEPSATRSQSECSTKLSLTPRKECVSDILQNNTDGHPRGVPIPLSHMGWISDSFFSRRREHDWMYSSPLCTNYNPTCVLCQMVPSAPIHICELDAYR